MQKDKKATNQKIKYLARPIAIKKQKWPIGTMPLVSISCTAYNQKDYIVKCIEGFLAQETTFPIEIIIHDDASTDGTAKIIKDYQLLYPHLFKITLQKKNQFSIGVNVNNFNFKLTRGKYIALCHGDDYWTDNRKLEKQVIAMQKYNVDISGHPAKLIDIKDNYLGSYTGFEAKKMTHFTAKKLINENGNMLPFGSIVITQSVKDNLLKYSKTLIFHTSYQLTGALNRGLLVLPDVMSVYRVDVPGSTTELMLGDIDKRIKTTIGRIHSIKTLKKLYGPSYYLILNKFLAKQLETIFMNKGEEHKPVILEEIMSNESIATRYLLHSLILKYGLKYKIKQVLI